MLVKILSASATMAIAVPQAAAAATIVVFTDPMTLDRRTVVLDTPGPDRLLFCGAPPAISGCREMAVTRVRR